MIKVQTLNHIYTLDDTLSGEFLIEGHPTFCPTPTKLRLFGQIMVGQPIFGDLWRGERYKGWHSSKVVAIYIS